MEDYQLSQKEVVQLVKDCTAKHAHAEVKFDLSMVEGRQQNLEGLMQHLAYAFKSGENDSSILAEFFSQSQKGKETFVGNLQVNLFQMTICYMKKKILFVH